MSRPKVNGRKRRLTTVVRGTLLFEAILNMYEHDRSSSKGIMTVHRNASFVFKHEGTDTDLSQRDRESKLGCAPAHELFALVEGKIRLREGVQVPRSINDYTLPSLNEVRAELPNGVGVYPMAGMATLTKAAKV